MTYVLNKALKMKKPENPNLHAPGQPSFHNNCLGVGCKDCKQVKIDCSECTKKNKPYELLKTGMVGGPSIVFYRYAEAGVFQIRPHKYRDPKTCASIVEFDANSLYLYCSGQEMHCSKEEHIEVESPQDPRTDSVQNYNFLKLFVTLYTENTELLVCTNFSCQYQCSLSNHIKVWYTK